MTSGSELQRPAQSSGGCGLLVLAALLAAGVVMIVNFASDESETEPPVAYHAPADPNGIVTVPDPDQIPSWNSPPPTISPQQTFSDEDRLYLDRVHERSLGFAAPTDDGLVELGRAVCADLDEGASPIQAIATLSADQGTGGGWLIPEFDQHQAGWIVGSAVAAYCPHHADELLELGAQLGVS